MKKTFIFIAASIVALASCTKENAPLPEAVAEKFTATIEQEISTKTTFGTDRTVLWEVGDAISINGCKYISDQSGATSTFTAAETEATANDATPKYTAIYPADLLSDNIMILPDAQNYNADSFDYMPMYASGDTKNLSFKNLCAVLAVTVPQAVATTVRSIEISSSSKALSGAFTISDNTLVLSDPDNYSNTMTLECGLGVSVPAAGMTFYIAIPSGTYPDLKITVCDGPKLHSISSNKSITVAKNKMYSITLNSQKMTTTDNCFRITALEGSCHIEECAQAYTAYGNVCLDDSGVAMPFANLMVSTNGGESWTEIDGDNCQFINIWLPKGESAIIKTIERAESLQGWGDQEQVTTIFQITGGKAKVSGEAMTLLNRTSSTDKSAGNQTFAGLFANSTSLVSARDLILPDNVGDECYLSTFQGCTALKDAPILPANSLCDYCYKSMFNGCSSLKSVTMLATSVTSTSFESWVDYAGSGTIYVAPSMVTNDTVTGYKYNFTIKAYPYSN